MMLFILTFNLSCPIIRNLAWKMAVILLCSVQNFKMIEVPKKKFWWTTLPNIWCQDQYQVGYLCYNVSLGIHFRVIFNPIMDSSIGLDNGLAPFRRQAIIWISDRKPQGSLSHMSAFLLVLSNLLGSKIVEEIIGFFIFSNLVSLC